MSADIDKNVEVEDAEVPQVKDGFMRERQKKKPQTEEARYSLN